MYVQISRLIIRKTEPQQISVSFGRTSNFLLEPGIFSRSVFLVGAVPEGKSMGFRTPPSLATKGW
jgi:hypothetical protein